MLGGRRGELGRPCGLSSRLRSPGHGGWGGAPGAPGTPRATVRAAQQEPSPSLLKVVSPLPGG